MKGLGDARASTARREGDVGPPPPKVVDETLGPFDVVLVAHALERSYLRAPGGDDHSTGFFKRCVTHFVRGVLKPFPGSEARPPLEILTTRESRRPYYSIGLQLPVDVDRAEATALVDDALNGKTATYKIFAPSPLDDADLDAIFASRDVDATKVLDWYAYPRYTAPQTFRPFVLDPNGVFYLNAVEQVASAMEMSAISARNAANLVRRHVATLGL